MIIVTDENKLNETQPIENSCLPEMLHLEKNLDAVKEFSPIIIEDNDSKRLSFQPMFNKVGETVTLRGVLRYQPLKTNTDGQKVPVKCSNILGRKDISLKNDQELSFELHSSELKNLLQVLETFNELKPNYDKINYKNVSQFFSLDTLVTLLKENWDLMDLYPVFHRLLLNLCNSASNPIPTLAKELTDALISNPDLIKTLPTDGNAYSVLPYLLSTITEEDAKKIPELIKGNKSEILQQALNVNNIKSFIGLLQDELNKNETEEFWQNLFTKNPWILSQLFPYPMVCFKDKVNIGGSLKEKGGIADFLYKNNLTSNISIIEIKASNLPLMKQTVYREGLKTYVPAEHVIGGVAQVSDYLDTLSKDTVRLDKEDLVSFNAQGVLIIGNISRLSKEQRKCFEIYRNNLKNILVVTYDELIARLELLVSCNTTPIDLTSTQ